jgi:hypothetical protein
VQSFRPWAACMLYTFLQGNCTAVSTYEVRTLQRPSAMDVRAQIPSRKMARQTMASVAFSQARTVI